MKTTAIATDRAPEAIGPYSQAIQAGDWIFLSGQIPLDPRTGQLIGTGIEAQTRQVMANLKAVLNAAGVDFNAVVKTTIYLADLGHFAVVNGIYGEAFPAIPPARVTVQVAALPKGALVEIDCIACRKG